MKIEPKVINGITYLPQDDSDIYKEAMEFFAYIEPMSLGIILAAAKHGNPLMVPAVAPKPIVNTAHNEAVEQTMATIRNKKLSLRNVKECLEIIGWEGTLKPGDLSQLDIETLGNLRDYILEEF
jgi:hypothetical protein